MNYKIRKKFKSLDKDTQSSIQFLINYIKAKSIKDSGLNINE